MAWHGATNTTQCVSFIALLILRDVIDSSRRHNTIYYAVLPYKMSYRSSQQYVCSMCAMRQALPTCLTHILSYVTAAFCVVDFITAEEEARLLEDIEGDHAAPWESDLTRRVKVLERLHQMYTALHYTC